MASTAKTSIAIGLEELEWARVRASEEGKSLSAFITEILHHQRKREAWIRVRDELMAGQPPFTEEELRAADAELFGDAPPVKRRAARARRKR